MSKPKRTAKEWWKWSVAEWKENTDSYCSVIRASAENILCSVSESNPDEAIDFAGRIFMSHGSDLYDSFYCICETASLVSSDKDIKEASSNAQTQVKDTAVEVASDERWVVAISYWSKHITNPESKRICELLKPKLVLRGALLDKKSKKQFLKISAEIKKLGKEFDNEIHAYERYITCTIGDLEGLTEAYIAGLEREGDLYKVSTASHQAGQFITYTPNLAKARELVVLSAQKGGKKNLARLNKMVQLRSEMAKLLGFDSFSEMNISVRSEKKPKKLLALGAKLAKELTPLYKFDTEMYRRVAGLSKNEKILMWQTGRLSNKLTKEVFKLPESQELKNYFKYDRVLPLIMKDLGRLFALTISEKPGKFWDKSVQCYSLCDAETNHYFGDIYFDMLYRPNKNEHPCCSGYSEGTTNPYILALTPNLPRSSVIVMSLAQPTKKVPTLIGLGSVETLWHELGHAVHNVLGSGHGSSIAGFNVSWDTVEIPSQLFEHFLWNEDSLYEYSEHYSTGEKLDKNIIQRLIASNDAMAGVGYRFQLLTYMYDLTLHGAESMGDVKDYYRKLYSEYLPDYEILEESLFPASLGHLSHGYEAGYYTYIWTNLIAYDIAGYMRKANGTWSEVRLAQFRKSILQAGNSADAIASIEQLLGRAINPETMIERFKKSYSVIADLIQESKK
jgi:Zn-dependent oligopeptidase